MRRVAVLLTTGLGLGLVACGDDGGGPADPDARPPIDAEESPDANPEMPGTLAETGLCVDDACEQIADDVYEFTPEWILWSDGASKRRWIYLPPGTQIDTSSMDYWQFPEGTKLWKEFTRGDVRVETRLLQKNGPDANDWYYAAYVWNEAQTEAVAMPLGQENANNTDHDVPSRSDCRKCHDRLPSRVLGFQAISLDHPDDGGLTLDDLVQMDWLTVEPTSAGLEYFPVPGDDTAQAALGYLHVNCGNCHNPMSDVQNMVSVVWRLDTASLATVASTPIWTTAVNVTPTLNNVPEATAIIEPDGVANERAAHSSAYLRMTSTSSAVMMPPIGHELVDDTGAAALAAWIESL